MPSRWTLPSRLFPRPASAWIRAGLVAVNVAAVVFYLLSFRHGIEFGPHREDLAVYRMGGRVWLRGGYLYRQPRGPGGRLRLPFTYPPVAAVLFSLAWLAPALAAVVADTLAAIALLGVVLRIFLLRLAGRAGASLWALAWLMPAALFIEPVRSELSLGQINIALMALVTADCLARFPGRSRGALTGLAAAIKLTPLAFVLFFLLRRDYRAAATAVLAFAAVTGVGFALAWHDSVRYWTAVIFQASRVGGLAYAGNQSLLGALARAGFDPASTTGLAVWLGLCLAVLAVTVTGMRRALAASEDGWALSLNALASLLVSPISWSHHWVWIVPALLTLAVLSGRCRSRLWAAITLAGVAVFAAGPQWWFPSGAGRELRWAAWEQIAGSSYVLFALVVLVLSGYAGTTITRAGSAVPTRPCRAIPGQGNALA